MAFSSQVENSVSDRSTDELPASPGFLRGRFLRGIKLTLTLALLK